QIRRGDALFDADDCHLSLVVSKLGDRISGSLATLVVVRADRRGQYRRVLQGVVDRDDRDPSLHELVDRVEQGYDVSWANDQGVGLACEYRLDQRDLDRWLPLGCTNPLERHPKFLCLLYSSV